MLTSSDEEFRTSEVNMPKILTDKAESVIQQRGNTGRHMEIFMKNHKIPHKKHTRDKKY